MSRIVVGLFQVVLNPRPFFRLVVDISGRVWWFQFEAARLVRICVFRPLLVAARPEVLNCIWMTRIAQVGYSIGPKADLTFSATPRGTSHVGRTTIERWRHRSGAGI